MIEFTVHGEAATAGSKRGFYNKKAGRVMITDDSARSRPWKALVADAAIQAIGDRDPFAGPLVLELTFWVRRPKSHMGTGRNADRVKPAAPSHPAVKPDLLKLARAAEDALTGIAYADDAQIVTEILHKAYTTGPARMVVRLVPVNQAADVAAASERSAA